MLDLKGFSDVGEMTRKDFLNAKSDAREWGRMSALRAKISAMSATSGSII